jgi:hypothetical protein
MSQQLSESLMSKAGGVLPKTYATRRAPSMEAMVLRETDKLVEDWESGRHRHDGLIYFMGWLEDGRFVPLYIGKAETFGKGDGNLSANTKNLKTDRSKFGRWGDNYAYHAGDLSACTLPEHPLTKQANKYAVWARRLFEDAPTLTPKLRKPLYF